MSQAKILVSVTAAALSLGFIQHPSGKLTSSSLVKTPLPGRTPKPMRTVRRPSRPRWMKGLRLAEGLRLAAPIKALHTQKIDQPPRQNPTTGD